jgi:NitT/TauT family transport system substrate-binding protein
MAAQLWVRGEDKVRNFASIPNMLKMLSQLRKEGQVANAIFVHDRSNGWKLFAENSYFVRSGQEISAFLLESDAKKFAAAVGGKVTDLGEIQ